MVGSPPCTAFTTLNSINDARMDPKEVQRRIEEGTMHLKCMARVYRRQMARGKFLIIEHPWSASNWKTKP